MRLDLADLDAVREKLKTLSSPQEALALIRVLEQKHREENYVQFWSPTETQRGKLLQFTPDKKIFGLLGGNRSGKTEVGAFLSVVWLLGKDYFRNSPAWDFVQHLPVPEPPNNIWVVGLDFPMLRDVIWREKLRLGKDHPGFLPKSDLLITKISDSDYQIFAQNGSVITGKSADSGREKFQGASVDLVWIDEEPEVEIFDECYQRTVDCAGKILLTLTPLSDTASGVRTPWVFDLYEEFKAGKKDVCFVQLSVLDNPYVPREEKDKLLDKWRDHPEEKARLYGDFIQRSGLVYNMWRPEVHLITPFRIPGHWFRVVSIDPAATGTTAALWAGFNENGDIYLYREYYERDMVVSEHAKRMLLRNGGDKIDIWLIDPKWGTQRNAETHKQNMQLYKDATIPVRLAVVGEDYGLNESREYMNATIEGKTSKHPRVFIFRDLANFRHEIEHYTWAFFTKGDQKGLSKEKPNKRNDHLMNAWQYLAAAKFRGKRGTGIQLTDEEQKLRPKLNSYT